MARRNFIRKAMDHSRRNESGSGMFIFMLFTFLLAVAFFGLAVDFSTTLAARNATQNTLDSSTANAVAQVRPDGTVDANEAWQRAEATYASGRQNLPATRCSGSQDASAAGGTTFGSASCPSVRTYWQVFQNGSRGVPEVHMEVQECSPNFFIHMLVPEICFKVSSIGRQALAYEPLG